MMYDSSEYEQRKIRRRSYNLRTRRSNPVLKEMAGEVFSAKEMKYIDDRLHGCSRRWRRT